MVPNEELHILTKHFEPPKRGEDNLYIKTKWLVPMYPLYGGSTVLQMYTCVMYIIFVTVIIVTRPHVACGRDTVVVVLVCYIPIHFFVAVINRKSQRMASLLPIDVHLCFCVCKTLEFWRRINVNTFGARFLEPFCQSHLLFSRHMVEDCAMFADYVLLFLCVC